MFRGFLTKIVAADSDGAANQFLDNVNKSGVSSFGGAIGDIVNWVIGIVGLVTVAVIIYGGIRYATSAGDPGKVTSAKNTILYGIVGLIIVVLAYAITTFVLGAFGTGTGTGTK